MSAIDHLGTYAEGWTTGDSEMILSATSDSFIFDDPAAGKIRKSEFTAYFAGLKESVIAGGGANGGVFMELSEVVTSEEDGILTASCWWAIPGTPIEGSGLIKVGPDGVLSERIAYYAKPAR